MEYSFALFFGTKRLKKRIELLFRNNLYLSKFRCKKLNSSWFPRLSYLILSVIVQVISLINLYYIYT